MKYKMSMFDRYFFYHIITYILFEASEIHINNFDDIL